MIWRSPNFDLRTGLFPQLASTSRGAGLKDFRFDDLRHHRGATMALDYFGDSAR